MARAENRVVRNVSLAEPHDRCDRSVILDVYCAAADHFPTAKI